MVLPEIQRILDCHDNVGCLVQCLLELFPLLFNSAVGWFAVEGILQLLLLSRRSISCPEIGNVVSAYFQLFKYFEVLILLCSRGDDCRNLEECFLSMFSLPRFSSASCVLRSYIRFISFFLVWDPENELHLLLECDICRYKVEAAQKLCKSFAIIASFAIAFATSRSGSSPSVAFLSPPIRRTSFFGMLVTHSVSISKNIVFIITFLCWCVAAEIWYWHWLCL